ncbi:hypothetical protein [Geomonas silvestris]|nr:hypothetical protein [Geomonas silvestris]
MDFEDFLNAQGLSLRTIDGVNLGIPPRPQMTNQFHILIRKRGEPLAPYFDSLWFIDAMKDLRRVKKGADSQLTNRVETIFWFTRLWLYLQWSFYEKISRHPAQISRYGDAMVLTSRFIEVVTEGVEKMGNAGRPVGEAGVMWDVLWKDRSNIKTWVVRFLKVMEQAGMIQETSVKGEYRQTLPAAVDMAVIADHELAYLMPPDREEDVETRSMMLITGAPLPTNIMREDANAAN